MVARKDVPREPNGRPSRRTGNPPGGSRPHGPEPLTEGLRLRMTQQQLTAVEGAAQAAGVGPQEWIRRAVQVRLDAAGGMPSAPG